MVFPGEDSIDRDLARALRQQHLDPTAFFRIIERIRSPQILTGTVMAEADTDVVAGNKIKLFTIKE